MSQALDDLQMQAACTARETEIENVRRAALLGTAYVAAEQAHESYSALPVLMAEAAKQLEPLFLEMYRQVRLHAEGRERFHDAVTTLEPSFNRP